MSHEETAMRVAGGWLAVASLLLAAVFVGHGPIHPDLSHQMAVIAQDSGRWIIIHWAAAAALSMFAIAGFIVLSARTRLTESWWTLSAWAVLPVGGLWTMTTAVAEATVIAGVAATGDVATFEAWWGFAEGKATGFMFLALSVAAIAANEARYADAVTPAWASWIACIAGIGAFSGWLVGMWFGIGFGSLVWVASSLVMSLWTLWFGLGLARATLALTSLRRAHPNT